MKERGILFSAPMVRALLAGTKTQTRRLVKPQPDLDPGARGELWRWPPGDGWKKAWRAPGADVMSSVCPYGAAGDRLWVRETWGLHDTQPADGHERATIFYRATDGERRNMRYQLWRPSIFMPRWASRITLEVTGVRVERLHAITEDDARAEGVRPFFDAYGSFGRDQRITSGEYARDAEHRASFAVLWDEINGDRALWFTNPWVWVVEFRKLEAR